MRELSDDGTAVEAMINQIDGCAPEGGPADVAWILRRLLDASVVDYRMPTILVMLAYGATQEQIGKRLRLTQSRIAHMLSSVKAIAAKGFTK